MKHDTNSYDYLKTLYNILIAEVGYSVCLNYTSVLLINIASWPVHMFAIGMNAAGIAGMFTTGQS